MGVTFDYFAAGGDAAAAALADVGPDAAGVRTVRDHQVDPTVHLAPLVALVLGRPMSEVGEVFADPVAIVNDGEQIVLPLTGVVGEALRTLEADRIAEIATTWSADSGFWRAPEPADLTAFLQNAAALARSGVPLYCRLSV